MKYRPIDLANTFIEKADGAGIQHMKLQKLCYYAHGWWLAYKDEPFLTERPQVWRYGPVFQSLYNILCHHRSVPITKPETPDPFEKLNVIDDQAINKLVDWVWERYSGYTAVKLSDMTHARGTPWRNIAERCNYKVPYNYEIPDEEIKAYFEKEAAKLKNYG